MAKLYLQDILDDISFENLPTRWQRFDLFQFLKDKTFSFCSDKSFLRGREGRI